MFRPNHRARKVCVHGSRTNPQRAQHSLSPSGRPFSDTQRQHQRILRHTSTEQGIGTYLTFQSLVTFGKSGTNCLITIKKRGKMGQGGISSRSKKKRDGEICKHKESAPWMLREDEFNHFFIIVKTMFVIRVLCCPRLDAVSLHV
jgi:hypothetical protein